MRADPEPLELEDVPRLVLAALPVVLLVGLFLAWDPGAMGAGMTLRDPAAAPAYTKPLVEKLVEWTLIGVIVFSILIQTRPGAGH